MQFPHNARIEVQYKDGDGKNITEFDVCTGVLVGRFYGKSLFGPSVTLDRVLLEMLNINDQACSYDSLKLDY